MGSDAETLLDACPTNAAILAGESRLNGYYWYLMEYAVVGEPGEKPAPGSIIDTLCQFPVLHQVAYL